MKKMMPLAVPAILLAATSAQAAGFLMVPESTNDRIWLFNATTGALVNDNFIDLAAATNGAAGTPIEALEVNGEIWVTDQVADSVWRFDQGGNLLGQIGGAGILDNIRGMEVVGNTVYVAQAGSTASFGTGIVTIDATTGMITGSFNGRDPGDTSYWDVKLVGNELLVTNSDTGNDGIERYDLAGNYLGVLVGSDGVDSFDGAQQIALAQNGNLLIGGFTPPSGVFEIGLDGSVIDDMAAAVGFGPRGVAQLDDGTIVWTNGTWFRSDEDIFGTPGNFRFITPTAIPTPGAAGLLGLAGIAAVRRRR